MLPSPSKDKHRSARSPCCGSLRQGHEIGAHLVDGFQRAWEGPAALGLVPPWPPRADGDKELPRRGREVGRQRDRDKELRERNNPEAKASAVAYAH